MKLELAMFGGLVPRTEPHNLPPEAATEAENCKLWTGGLDGYFQTTRITTPTKQGVKKSIYRFNPTAGDANSGNWFHWTVDVDVVRGPVRGDTSERTYYTGDGAPKVTQTGIATQGGTDYPENSYTLGIPAPATAPRATVTGTADSDATEADRISRTYVVTYVSAWGEEGPPSPASGLAELLPGQTVDLSAIPGPPTGNYNITTQRIYRTATGAASTQYYFVAEVPVSTSTYNDSILDSVIGEALPSEAWDPPPEDMHSIGILDNGIAYGCSKNELYLSEPYLPHAWNPLNAQPSNYPFVGAGGYENTIVGITTKNPYVVTGIDPAAMNAYELKINQGCVSKRSIVSGPYGVVYASPDGLVLIGPQSRGDVITRHFLTRDDWKALNPASILGCLYNGMYMGFYEQGNTRKGFIIDPSHPEAGFVHIGLFATAAHSDALADDLYLCIDGHIVTWDTAAAKLTYTWQSKLFIADRPANYTAVRILADDYDSLTFTPVVGGVEGNGLPIANDGIYRLPFKADRHFQFKLSGTSKVQRVEVAESAEELRR